MIKINVRKKLIIFVLAFFVSGSLGSCAHLFSPVVASATLLEDCEEHRMLSEMDGSGMIGSDDYHKDWSEARGSSKTDEPMMNCCFASYSDLKANNASQPEYEYVIQSNYFSLGCMAMPHLDFSFSSQFGLSPPEPDLLASVIKRE